MSVVERALEKLRNTRPAGAGAEDQSPTIARLQRLSLPVAEPDGGEQLAEPKTFIEFDLSALGRAGLYSSRNSRLPDEYRMIKRRLLKNVIAGWERGEKRSNLLMITSALPGEGKTFTSVNLSLSTAKEKDWTVLLIDSDCRNPQLSRLLGVQRSLGLLDALKDPSLSAESLVLGTNIERLSVLPLGTADSHSSELLSSSQMRALCEKLSNPSHKRLVVFDSTPLLLTTESTILSAQVGQVAMVVRANSTPKNAVMEAVEKIDSTKAIGLILNRADVGDGTLYGSYGNYGSYGHSPHTGTE